MKISPNEKNLTNERDDIEYFSWTSLDIKRAESTTNDIYKDIRLKLRDSLLRVLSIMIDKWLFLDVSLSRFHLEDYSLVRPFYVLRTLMFI